MPLTDTGIKNLKPLDKPQKKFDVNGLFLLVQPNGGKWWRFKYRFAGKEKLLSFGTYPEVSLATARAKRDEARKQVAAGVDPSEQRKVEKAKLADAIDSAKREVEGLPTIGTFEAVAWDWFNAKISHLSDSHKTRTLAYLKNDLIPYLGKLPISEIKAPQLLECLRRIALRKNKRGQTITETANRVREQMGQLWRFAIAVGFAERDIAADLRGGAGASCPKEFFVYYRTKDIGAAIARC